MDESKPKLISEIAFDMIEEFIKSDLYSRRHDRTYMYTSDDGYTISHPFDKDNFTINKKYPIVSWNNGYFDIYVTVDDEVQKTDKRMHIAIADLLAYIWYTGKEGRKYPEY